MRVKTIELLNKIPEQDRKIKQLQSENEALKKKLEEYQIIYRHSFLGVGLELSDRFCGACGLYLTDPIHKRVGDE